MAPTGTPQINKPLVLWQVEKIYLQNPLIKARYDAIIDVRSEMKKYIVCRKCFSSCLDEICNNTIGEIAMKLLIANLDNKNEALFLEAGKSDNFDRKRTITINPQNYNIVNLDNYDPKGETKEALCGIHTGIGDTTQIIEKKDTISEAMFHELCHALHKYSGREKEKCGLLNLTYGENGRGKYLWTGNKNENQNSLENDEEMYTITGHYYDENTKVRRLDPISCNMFDICTNVLNPESIIQRVLHYDYSDYKEYLTEYNILESEALYKIEEFLIDIDEYTIKCHSTVADKITETAKK
jgi:hypothetical protein